MFLPMSRDELIDLGWSELDVILVSGDAYVDSPYIGIAVIGRVLLDAGYRVGIIAQPDIESEDIKRLGEPKIFWGVSGGSVDSMVANYTSLNKKRRGDDYTPGGENTKRADRAVIVYSNLIRSHFKNTKPILLGGIESSLRRISHYDYWSDKIRRSILFDAKANYLIYGMAERAVLEFAEALKEGREVFDIDGLCYISKEKRDGYIEIPSFEEVKSNKNLYAKSFEIFYKNCDAYNSKGISQKQDNRYLIQNPPQKPLTQDEIDRVFDLDFQRDAHPLHKKDGEIKALEVIRFSITTHYGCYGECSFCAIAMHQGRYISSRSEESILKEVDKIANLEGFKGVIDDVGGASANMYGFECDKKVKSGSCEDRSCIGTKSCKTLKPTHKRQIELLKKIRKNPKIKKVFVTSGIRYDLIEQDREYGEQYLEDIVKYHISGQLKIAPEHTNDAILKIMNKPDSGTLLRFKERFDRLNKLHNKKQFLTYYFIAAHPLCGEKEMEELKKFTKDKLKTIPRQTQVFTPTPSTLSTLIYYTQKDPKSGKDVFVEKSIAKKRAQKEILQKGISR